jgi:predicted phosphodiesterase
LIVGVVSDIHSNIVALQAVLAQLNDNVEEVWCLGDIVGYGPCPNETVELIAGLKRCRCIAGNHDWGALGRIDIKSFNLDASAAARWTAGTLNSRAKKYLEELPVTLLVGNWTLVHGSPRDSMTQYLFDCGEAVKGMNNLETQAALVGHTHVPTIYQRDYQSGVGTACRELPAVSGAATPIEHWPTIINPGSIGQPRDGDPDASFLLLDTEKSVATFQRVAYDIEETQAQMQRAGLPERLWQRLSYGL